MKAVKPEKDGYEPVVVSGRWTGFALRVLLLILGLAVLGGLYFQYRTFFTAETYLIALAVLAVIGVFFIVSLVLGLVRMFPSDGNRLVAKGFLDQYPEAVIITDHRDRTIYTNSAYGALIGEAGAVQSLDTLFSAEAESAESLYRLSHIVRGGQNGQEEFRLSRPISAHQGSAEDPHWYRLSARFMAVENDQGRLRNHHVWQVRDITAERQDQERYFRELQKAIDYLDHAPVGFFTASGDGAVQYINATFAEWLDIDLAAFEPGALSLSDILTGEDMMLLRSVYAAPGERRSESLEVSLRLPSGRHMPVRLLHDVTTAREGNIVESRTVVLKRHDNESLAGAGAERFFNDTPMAIATVARNGALIATNGRFLSMFKDLIRREDVGAKAQIASVIDEADRSKMQDALLAAADGQGEIVPFEARYALDDGRHFRFFVHASNGADDAVALVYVIDISEQKALEAQMARTQKLNAVGTLAGGIAHDFNNVLTAILLSADHLLLQSRPADPDFADLIEIKRNANRASQLVRQLLAFSRQQTMRPQVVDLTDVIDDMRMMIERLTGGADIKLKIDFGRDLWSVKTDPGQFGQVVTNLCVNARDAMPEGGTLTVRTRNVPASEVAALGAREVPERDFVMVEVSDTGTGIAPDVLDKIFEPFFTTKDVGKGTGLGLAMVYGIVTQSGGFIHPVSEIGKGTRFLILLPRHQRDAAAAATHQHQPTDHKGVPINAAFSEAAADDDEAPVREADMDMTGQSAVVLLVEDEDAVRRSGKRMLEMRGFTVHEADTGVHALKILGELGGKVDIVVSDVVMPEMDGPTLLREARKDYPELKFIFVSGYADDAFAKNLPEDAKFGFLPKPYNLKQLVASVWEMLREG
ncbi:ATP-binding protein [Martelella sp. HB161492]|uniref:cell cycle histidine kinase CckA n=1 Tax=Martelella sp. HB161492 TaxID=2720726 RepID=UPI0015923F74|nr:ATP-binding protein [Martelella sp. HB161492]